MKNRKHIQEELHELGVDLSVVEMPDMEIPSHFFESFSTLMLEAVKSNDVITSLPIEMPIEMPFDIPELYIEQLSDNVRDVIIEEKIMEALPKTMPYEVPAHYFTELPAQVNATINVVPRSVFNRVLISRLTLAATLLLFMGISQRIFMNPVRTKHANTSFESQLAIVSDAEVDQYLLLHQAAIESSLVLVNIDESSIDLQKLEVEMLDDTFNNLSDEELLNYTL
jgi:hypothetical protein